MKLRSVSYLIGGSFHGRYSLKADAEVFGMKAVVRHGRTNVPVDEVDDPHIIDPTDAISKFPGYDPGNNKGGLMKKTGIANQQGRLVVKVFWLTSLIISLLLTLLLNLIIHLFR